ncbi:MAG: hypothetical protein JWR04_1687 [Rhodoglobus sp.]|nr:hypothetical protein [Rhodoglobus sp.]
MSFLDRVASARRTRAAGEWIAATVNRVTTRFPWLIAERIAAIVILLLALYFLSVAVSYGLNDGAQAAPGTFPALAAAALVVLSVIWLFTAKPLKKDVEDETPGEEVLDHYAHQEGAAQEELAEAAAHDADATGALESDSHPIRLIFVLVWSAVALPFVEVIGMIPLLFVYLTGLFVVVAQLKWWKVMIFTALTLLLAAYGAYVGGIYLPDPIGIGPFLYGIVARIFGW